MAEGQHRIHPVDQQRVVPGIRVARAGLLRERDGPLGQAFKDEIVECALFGQFDRRLNPVAGKASPSTNPNRRAGVQVPFTLWKVSTRFYGHTRPAQSPPPILKV